MTITVFQRSSIPNCFLQQKAELLVSASLLNNEALKRLSDPPSILLSWHLSKLQKKMFQLDIIFLVY